MRKPLLAVVLSALAWSAVGLGSGDPETLAKVEEILSTGGMPTRIYLDEIPPEWPEEVPCCLPDATVLGGLVYDAEEEPSVLLALEYGLAVSEVFQAYKRLFLDSMWEEQMGTVSAVGMPGDAEHTVFQKGEFLVLLRVHAEVEAEVSSVRLQTARMPPIRDHAPYPPGRPAMVMPNLMGVRIPGTVQHGGGSGASNGLQRQDVILYGHATFDAVAEAVNQAFIDEDWTTVGEGKHDGSIWWVAQEQEREGQVKDGWVLYQKEVEGLAWLALLQISQVVTEPGRSAVFVVKATAWVL